MGDEIKELKKFDISKEIAMTTASIASLKELIKTRTKEYQIAVAQVAKGSQPEPMVQHVHEEPVFPVLQNEHVQQSSVHEEPVPDLHEETVNTEPIDAMTAWRLKVNSLCDKFLKSAEQSVKPWYPYKGETNGPKDQK